MSVTGKQFDQFPRGPRESGYWNDWHSDNELLDYTITDFAGGSASVLDTLRGGYLRISGASATDNSGKEVQRNAVSVQLAAGKTLRILGRMKLSDASQCDAFFGLLGPDTSIIASPPNDAIYFRKDDDDPYLDCVIRSGGVEAGGSVAAYTVSDAEDLELAIEVAMTSVANTGTVKFYVGGSSSPVVSVTSANLPSGLMAIAMGMISGNASGTKTADFDYDGVTWVR